MADVDELFNCFNEEAEEAALEPPVAIKEGPVVVEEKTEVQKDNERYLQNISMYIMIYLQINMVFL